MVGYKDYGMIVNIKGRYFLILIKRTKAFEIIIRIRYLYKLSQA